MSSPNDIRDTFFVECEELLEAMADGLNDMDAAAEEGTTDLEVINAVFRAVHSIKGGAGAFGLEELVHFAHRFETAMDLLRAGTLALDPEVMRVFHRSSDRLSDLVALSRDELEIDEADSAPLIEELNALIGEEEEEPDSEDLGFVPMGLPMDLGLPADDGPQTYEIRFKAHDGLYANGNDTALLFRALADLGQLTVSADADALPAFDVLTPETAVLEWVVDLETTESEQTIHDVFEFAEGLCDLSIAPKGGGGLIDLEDLPAIDLGPDEEAAPEAEAIAEPEAESAPAPEPKAAPSSASPAAAKEKAKPSGPRATVRVDLDRVDRLINVVGELVINQAMLSQCVHEAGIPPGSEISAGLDEFKQLSREIQESVMAIRAQPVKSLFQRMSRIVREASDQAGKKARLIVEGETTEVDKTVIERLADPLTHMIRNAIDHGLEPPEKRMEIGKPEFGTVTLSAAHRSGRVLIEISDDGAGINRPRVRQIAIDKGLIPADADLSDNDIDNLLFMPGFSTAKEISSLSGRGVGMDVVKKSINELGGRVAISSSEGKGSVFSISLPLTLAVLEGMIVDVAGQTMVVPLTAIIETMRPRPEDIHRIGTGDRVVSVRGEFIPITDLAASFGYREAGAQGDDSVLLLVETDQNRTSALEVDAIHDQRQVVIKGLEANYGHVPGVAAATILGDGRIALIIDPEASVAQHVNFSMPTAALAELQNAAEG